MYYSKNMDTLVDKNDTEICLERIPNKIYN